MTRIPVSAFDEPYRSLCERLEMSTAEMGLSVRTTQCLESREILTLRDLVMKGSEHLDCFSNYGEQALEEVFLALESVGFHRSTRSKA